MEKRSKKIAKTLITAAVAVGVASIGVQSLAASSAKCAVEKCYGIAKKNKNDCGTPRHACAGQSAAPGAKQDWMYVMKGNCERIVGGALTPPGQSQTKTTKHVKPHKS